MKPVDLSPRPVPTTSTDNGPGSTANLHGIDPSSAVGVGRACGKVILIGEHTVVYGLPALAVPLTDLTVEARARFVQRSTGSGDPTESDDHTVTYRFSDGPHTTEVRNGPTALAAIAAALRQWGCAHTAVEVWVDSRVPPARGLGFSAACATAVVRALADLIGESIDDRVLYELVQSSEQLAHGRASGVDAMAVAASAPIRFEAGVSRPIVVGSDATLLIADTGRSGSTLEAVAAVGSLLKRDQAWTSRRLTEAATIIESAHTDLVAGRMAALGERMTEFHALLREFGVSTVEIEQLVQAARAAGAYGVKLTGGGLGGCVLALVEPESAQTVGTALMAAGASRLWSTSIRERKS